MASDPERSVARRSREDNRLKARQFMAAGNDRAAYEHYQRGLEATPLMARAFIEACALHSLHASEINVTVHLIALHDWCPL